MVKENSEHVSVGDHENVENFENSNDLRMNTRICYLRVSKVLMYLKMPHQTMPMDLVQCSLIFNLLLTIVENCPHVCKRIT
jgi:hypothetical protein